MFACHCDAAQIQDAVAHHVILSKIIFEESASQEDLDDFDIGERESCGADVFVDLVPMLFEVRRIFWMKAVAPPSYDVSSSEL